MSRQPTLRIDPTLDPCPARAALVWAVGMTAVAPAERPPVFLQQILDRVAAGEAVVSAERKAAVRDMLRHGAYKPAGRSKPASEYLLGAAAAGTFPLVNGPVDVNNAVSLQWGYPASIFDAQKSGWDLLLRRGRLEENYVFNPAGQTIDLRDLLCVCRKVDDVYAPCGNPVKDSMATKTSPSTTDVIAVVFAPVTDPIEELRAAADRFSSLLSTHCGAAETGVQIV